MVNVEELREVFIFLRIFHLGRGRFRVKLLETGEICLMAGYYEFPEDIGTVAEKVCKNEGGKVAEAFGEVLEGARVWLNNYDGRV